MATSPTYPETPLVKQGTVTPSENGYKATGNSIARIPEIDFVEQFNENINKLSEALSLTRKLSLSEGSIVRRYNCLLYTSPSPRDYTRSRMPSSA